MRDKILELSVSIFGGQQKDYRVYRAPGRVNLIGEHTDYNEGYVLPAAIDRWTYIAIKKNADKIARFYAGDFSDKAEADLGKIESVIEHKWLNYPLGAIWALSQKGYDVSSGVSAVILGNVPIGAGLSSSASIEVVTAFALCDLWDMEISLVDLALLCQFAENKFVGVNCGIMDQFIICMGKESSSLFIDCRNYTYQHVNIPQDLALVICNTNVKRGLLNSEYNTRREECDKAVQIVKEQLGKDIKALRDVSKEELELCLSSMPENVAKRARHIVYENARVLDTVSAFRRDNKSAINQLMAESHQSLKDDYNVSCSELDIMVESAIRHPACIGARMTGAGFGGCTVNLVKRDEVKSFADSICRDYQSRTGKRCDAYICVAVNGVERVC